MSLPVLAMVLTPTASKALIDVGPQVVIAHVDAGINPYAAVFRDTSPLGYTYPGDYIPGYPANAERLDLDLNAPDWQTAFNHDKPIWDKLLADWNADKAAFSKRIFWIPGTKIIAALRLGPGTTYCPVTPVAPAPFPGQLSMCTDYPILDDVGHGTMTATRMGGNRGSLCPQCRIVSIEGLGDTGVRWLADQGWIDVQTNSWGYIVPHAAIHALDYAATLGIQENIEFAAAHMPVYFASGNGIDGAAGFAPCPTEEGATLVKGVIMVGAHDNGHVAPWSCAPAHIVADGYGGLTAGNHSIDFFGSSPFACCTSAASPYAAGQGAEIILQARRLLGDSMTGPHEGVLAKGPPGLVSSGPLADGDLTLAEFKDLVFHTAEARPQEGKDDGAIQWVGAERAPDPTSDIAPYGIGANPYCQGCVTLPITWTDVPADFPAYLSIGYGAANERSLARAEQVLQGKASPLDRSEVDAFFANGAMVKDILQNPEQFLPPLPL